MHHSCTNLFCLWPVHADLANNVSACNPCTFTDWRPLASTHQQPSVCSGISSQHAAAHCSHTPCLNAFILGTVGAEGIPIGVEALLEPLPTATLLAQGRGLRLR